MSPEGSCRQLRQEKMVKLRHMVPTLANKNKQGNIQKNQNHHPQHQHMNNEPKKNIKPHLTTTVHVQINNSSVVTTKGLF